MKKTKLKGAYNLLIVAPRFLGCKINLYEIMGWESSDVVRFGLGPLLQDQMMIVKLKLAYNSLIIGPRVLGYQTNL